MTSVANSSQTDSTPAKADPLRMIRFPGWRPVEAALIAMLLSSFAISPWMWDAYAPSDSGDSAITPGMSREQVIVKLGEPNERDAKDVCWNFNRFQGGNDRFCVRFDETGRVAATSRNPDQ